jgi:hypothetical protein
MPDNHDEPRGLNPAQREVEGALRSLAPAPARVDPVAAAFNAGRRSAGRQVHLWRSAAAFLLLLSAGSWLVPLSRKGSSGVTPPEPAGSLAVIPTRSQVPPTPAQPLPEESLIMLQQAVRDKGLDGLPAPRLPAVREVGAGDLF